MVEEYTQESLSYWGVTPFVTPLLGGHAAWESPSSKGAAKHSAQLFASDSASCHSLYLRVPPSLLSPSCLPAAICRVTPLAPPGTKEKKGFKMELTDNLMNPAAPPPPPPHLLSPPPQGERQGAVQRQYNPESQDMGGHFLFCLSPTLRLGANSFTSHIVSSETEMSNPGSLGFSRFGVWRLGSAS